MLGKTAIAQMGTLIHFNCSPQAGKVICELTREPLIGKSQTRDLDKTELVKTQVQSSQSSTRLTLLTREGELPFTHNWSSTANAQLLAQRDQIDQFLNTPEATSLYVRTHRPWQLWAILAGLGLISGLLTKILFTFLP